MKRSPTPSRRADPERLTCEVAGYMQKELHFNPHICRCGGIKDGVAFEHGREGGWVIAFKDLERFYLRAKEYRDDR